MLLEHETSLKPYLYSPIRSLILGGTIPGNPPLWFIPSLFVTQCLFAFMRDRKINIYICAFIGLLGGALLPIINCDFVPVYIGSGILGVFYFAMGRIMHKYEGTWKVIVGAVLVCAVLLLINHTPNAELRYITQYSGNVLDYIQGVDVTHWIVLLIISRLLMGDILHVWDEKLQSIITGIGCLLVIPTYIIIKNQWIKRTVL